MAFLDSAGVAELWARAKSAFGHTLSVGTASTTTDVRLQTSAGATLSTGTIPAATASAAGVLTAADKSKLDGIAAGATANAGTITGVTTTSPLSGSGTSGSVAISHAASGATAGTYGPTANAAPAFGGTFSVPSGEVNATGHVTSAATRSVTMPSTVATASASGLMSAADKSKLDGVAAGATAFDGIWDSLSGRPVKRLTADANLWELSAGIYLSTTDVDVDTNTNGTSSLSVTTGSMLCVYVNNGITYGMTFGVNDVGRAMISLAASDNGTYVSNFYYFMDQVVRDLCLNGNKTLETPSFYAPTQSGTSGYLLESNGYGAPKWVEQSSIAAGSATTAGKLGSASVGSATIPVYLNAGAATACGTSLAVSVTGTAAKATADASGNVIASTYARLASPALTGTPTAPTASAGTATTQVATTAFVGTAVANAVASRPLYAGTVGTSGATYTESTLEASAYKVGWYFFVTVAGTYVGQACEVGDMLICSKDKGTAYAASDWDVVQQNIAAMSTADVDAICV